MKIKSVLIAVSAVFAAFQPLSAQQIPCITAKTTWHTGYVGSDSNKNKTNAIETNENVYAFTDVIELPYKGIKVEFTDPHNGITSDNAYCVSNWRKHRGAEEISLGDPRFKAMPSFIVTKGPDGTKYSYTASGPERIRLCYRAEGTHLANPPAVKLYKTKEPGTWYLQNKAAADANAEWVEKDKARFYCKELEGKTVFFLGDSYLDGNGLPHEYVWPTLLKMKYNLKIDNHGRNGAAICDFDPNRNPMLFYYQELGQNLPKGTKPDVIIFEGGRNDFNVKAPIGTNDSRDTKTVKGAIRTIVEALRKQYPGAVVIGMTTWETGQGNCSDYGRAMLDMCAELKMPVINGLDIPANGIRMNDQNWRRQNCLNEWDASHMNANGMKRLSRTSRKSSRKHANNCVDAERRPS